MTEETRRWFLEKVAQEPEYLSTHFLPALDKLVSKADHAFYQAARFEGVDQIKYRMGWLDGVREVHVAIEGLKKSRGEIPAEPGLLARIFSTRS